MKRTRLKQCGKIGKINRVAARINRDKFEQQENKMCAVPGCANMASQPHHRHPRHQYRRKNPDDMVKALTAQADIVWLCGSCHSRIRPMSQESEALFE